MMDIRFITLSLNCREAVETIDLSAQVSFFHGKVSSGKSSIARLINFCLGGKLERTPAIQKELLSVRLELEVGTYQILLERNCNADSLINATCIGEDQKSFAIAVPVASGSAPVYADTVYNISDLIFYLLGIQVIRIPVNKTREDSGLVRLSIKNFLWYCYLDQNKLDNSFFRHEDPTKVRNSKSVLRYVLKYSNEQLADLEARLQQFRVSRITATTKAQGLREFLQKFGFSTERQIEQQVEKTRAQLEVAKNEKAKHEAGYTANTHQVDGLRFSIRNLVASITIKEEAILDLENRVREQEALRSELVASKFKLAKNKSIANVFQGVAFDNCPACGSTLTDKVKEPDHCVLCGTEVGHEKVSANENLDTIQTDLSDRIKELEASVDLHKRALARTKRELSIEQKRRMEMDDRLQEELKTYESIFLSSIRKIDRDVAMLEERTKGYRRLKQMPREISRLEEEAGELAKKEELLKIQIREERQRLTEGKRIVDELEEEFLQAMLKVGVPGISEKDKVVINRQNWDVLVWAEGQVYQSWNFYNAGSGGKKTLFNSCFLLALHIVAARNNLPLPTFIIIDTPMKNIDKEVNLDIFKNFFDYVYELATTVLDRVQFIIVDNNFIAPKQDLVISFYERIMDANDPDHPPLISYYKGA